MTTNDTEAGKPAPAAEPLALRLNDQLGPPPAYLGDGQTAYAAGIVASWPEHNRARFRALLFTGEQLERAVAEERERCARLCDDEFPRLQSSAERDLCAWLAQRIRKA